MAMESMSFEGEKAFSKWRVHARTFGSKPFLIGFGRQSFGDTVDDFSRSKYLCLRKKLVDCRWW